MIKKSVLMSFCFLLASCTILWKSKEPDRIPENCPLVVIPRDVAYLIQKVNYRDDFQIELKGYEGYCYVDEYSRRRKAVITPKFEIRRLRGRLDETDVDFSFFTETVQGPPAFLGKKHYFEQTSVALEQRQKRFDGRTVEVAIPDTGYQSFPIYLGLELTPEEQKYNNRTFDIQFNYEENY